MTERKVLPFYGGADEMHTPPLATGWRLWRNWAVLVGAVTLVAAGVAALV